MSVLPTQPRPTLQCRTFNVPCCGTPVRSSGWSIRPVRLESGPVPPETTPGARDLSVLQWSSFTFLKKKIKVRAFSQNFQLLTCCHSTASPVYAFFLGCPGFYTPTHNSRTHLLTHSPTHTNVYTPPHSPRHTNTHQHLHANTHTNTHTHTLSHTHTSTHTPTLTHQHTPTHIQ